MSLNKETKCMVSADDTPLNHSKIQRTFSAYVDQALVLAMLSDTKTNWRQPLKKLCDPEQPHNPTDGPAEVSSGKRYGRWWEQYRHLSLGEVIVLREKLRDLAQPHIDHVMKFYDPKFDSDGRNRPTLEKMQSLAYSPWWKEYSSLTQKEIMALREQLDREVD